MNARTLNYPGDVRDAVGQRVGPNMLGEWMWITDAFYDPEADTTKAVLAYRPPAVQEAQ